MANPARESLERPFKGENGAILRRDFGLRCGHLRLAHDLQQQELAVQLGLTVWAMSRYEGGKAFPRVETLVRLRGIFSSTLDYLVLGEKQLGVSDHRVLRRLPRIESLPPAAKLTFLHMVDSYLGIQGLFTDLDLGLGPDDTPAAGPGAGARLWTP